LFLNGIDVLYFIITGAALFFNAFCIRHMVIPPAGTPLPNSQPQQPISKNIINDNSAPINAALTFMYIPLLLL